LKKICNKKELGLALMFGSFILMAIIPSSVVGIAWGQTTTTPLISTRNHFDRDTGELHTGHNSRDYDASDNIPGLDRQCEGEVAIYVHGVWTTTVSPSFPYFENAIEIFDRARMSLADLQYRIPLIGFSWDSNTPISPAGWWTAKIIAKENGPKLAEFLYDLKETCPNTAIRLIAHSMGARVVLSSLDSLTNNPDWNNNNFKIASVHLMGAAVDDDEVSKNAADVLSSDGIRSAYGNAIEKEVVRFYNLYNPEDDVLEGDDECAVFICQPIYYPKHEHDLALGQSGAQSGIDIPENYDQINARSQIDFNVDADGDWLCDLLIPSTTLCSINRAGDNHFGYPGFRFRSLFFTPFLGGTLIDNGAMNIVVDNWNNPP
jgi:hypothetical protein